MILENLFAQAAQGRTFLMMCVCGLLLGAMLHLSRTLRQWKPWLGNAADVLAALALGGMALGVLLLSGGGLRGYALLGLLLGAALYQAGLSRPVGALGRLLMRLLQFLAQKVPGKAGNAPSADESVISSNGGRHTA
ncbi:MAG: hypothetical protein J1E43_05845 [Christensenellaceae bacterium]|nr:hypothetical protein [Christensenellaceae bacterium]